MVFFFGAAFGRAAASLAELFTGFGIKPFPHPLELFKWT